MESTSTGVADVPVTRWSCSFMLVLPSLVSSIPSPVQSNKAAPPPSRLLALRRAASRLHQQLRCQGAWLTLSTRSLTADIAHSEQKKKKKKIIGLIKTSGGNAGQRRRCSLRLPMSQRYVRSSPTFSPHVKAAAVHANGLLSAAGGQH